MVAQHGAGWFSKGQKLGLFETNPAVDASIGLTVCERLFLDQQFLVRMTDK